MHRAHKLDYSIFCYKYHPYRLPFMYKSILRFLHESLATFPLYEVSQTPRLWWGFFDHRLLLIRYCRLLGRDSQKDQQRAIEEHFNLAWHKLWCLKSLNHNCLVGESIPFHSSTRLHLDSYQEGNLHELRIPNSKYITILCWIFGLW